ncbi:hypothetical protein Q4485_07210 [Granulosicoccaceae sp. 1_MG-2023]|nr:hypothetical protein [Granulosicoccaceae sp. 1_MG-2023]
MDLIEAEAALLRRMMLDGFSVMLAMTGAAVAAGAGIVLLLMLLYTQLRTHFGSAVAGLCLALLCFALSGACLWLVKHLKR